MDAHIDTLVSEQASYILNRVDLGQIYAVIQRRDQIKVHRTSLNFGQKEIDKIFSRVNYHYLVNCVVTSVTQMTTLTTTLGYTCTRTTVYVVSISLLFSTLPTTLLNVMASRVVMYYM